MGTTDDAELKPVPSKSEKPERVSKSVGVPIKVVSGLLLLWGIGLVAMLHGHEKGGSAIEDGHARILHQMAKRKEVGVPAAGKPSNVHQLSLDFLKRYAVMADGADLVLPSPPPVDAAASPRKSGLVETVDARRSAQTAAPAKRAVPPGPDSTIFVSIASYRDRECAMTIQSCLDNAKFKSRLVFGIVQQNMPGDDDCLDTFCAKSACDKKQFRVTRMSTKESQGPTYARALAEELLGDEDFFMQIDSHSYFRAEWDVLLMDQWKAINNEHGILTVYPMPVDWNTADANQVDSQLPHICQAEFSLGNDDQGFPKFHSFTSFHPPKPRLAPFWAAGFSFSKSHAVQTVPYDKYTPFQFHGEEFSRGCRLWTFGYDFYSPSVNVIFHHYGRSGLPKMFDEDWNARFPKVVRSAERVKAILGLAHASDDFDHTEMDKYGVGRRRTVPQFLAWAGIDLEHHTGKNLCSDADVPWVPPDPPW